MTALIIAIVALIISVIGFALAIYKAVAETQRYRMIKKKGPRG